MIQKMIKKTLLMTCPLGLKAIAITKAIASTKNAIKLAVEENVALVKAITQQLSTLSTAPVNGE